MGRMIYFFLEGPYDLLERRITRDDLGPINLEGPAHKRFPATQGNAPMIRTNETIFFRPFVFVIFLSSLLFHSALPNQFAPPHHRRGGEREEEDDVGHDQPESGGARAAGTVRAPPRCRRAGRARRLRYGPPGSPSPFIHPLVAR
jgi:hypothetical protein